jgi:UDP-2,3-diacylglucosamine pyrophosphatase LpxH
MVVLGVAAITGGVTILVAPLLAIPGTQFTVQTRRLMQNALYTPIEVIHLDELKAAQKHETYEHLMKLDKTSYKRSSFLLLIMLPQALDPSSKKSSKKHQKSSKEKDNKSRAWKKVIYEHMADLNLVRNVTIDEAHYVPMDGTWFRQEF